MSSHSPAPWIVGENFNKTANDVILNADSHIIYVGNTVSKDDLAHLVKCVNEHAVMLKMLAEIMTNKHASIEDHFYKVKENEGEGWNGPSLVAWGEAISAAKQLLITSGLISDENIPNWLIKTGHELAP